MFSKKTAVAAAALLAAFAAQAQSQVNLYGNVDLSVGSFKEPGQKATTKVESGSLRASYIGFKGTEDLGGGLKAFFKLESDIAADTGTASSTFWARTSAIGLAGDFGTATLGNVRSLAYLTNTAFNPFADSAVFSASNLFGQVGAVNANANSGTNYKNSITYTSPNLSGFTGAVQFGASETNGVDGAVALQGTYTAGPLAAGLVYEDVALTANTDSQRWQLAASYDFGIAKAFAQYGQGEVDGQAKTEKFFQIGASAPVTAAGTVLASYGQLKNDNGANAKTTEFSLAYDHAISKRTGAYAGVNNTKVTGAKAANTFAVGVRHAF